MSSDALAAAVAAGREITDAAVWYDGRCSWIGATSGGAGTFRAFGPTLYKGTAGVGLFLAQLAAVTGEAEPRRTALGALRHAVTAAARQPAAGFHVGTTGVAWAAVTAAALLDAEELDAGARALLDAPDAPDAAPDVLTGDAGTVLGLLALDDARMVERAGRLGERLLAGARQGPRGWSWPTPDRVSRRHLYGLAHGSSGIAWALRELHAATADERFLAAAERGFAYERSWFEERHGCWAAERLHGSPQASTGSWCHGEAGIALITGSAEARAATQTWLADQLQEGIRDLSLCHGATGAAEALPPDAPERAAVAAYALERTPRDWPGGLPGASPALFRGTSGIAWWLLRVHDVNIPSPVGLTVRPERT